MYELIQATEHSYYIENPSKIGIVKLNETDVCLIDSGSDKDAGRKVRQILEAHNWHLTAIYNTHANADHIGGNKYLQGQTGCKIYAPDINCEFTKHPVLEPAFLYGGFPPKDLRHKFLMAQESSAAELTNPAGGLRNHPAARSLLRYGRLPDPGRRSLPGRLPVQPPDSGQIPDKLHL